MVDYAAALGALYQEQVNAGFVLADPAERPADKDINLFDPVTGITFAVQWNPDRDIRGNHAELIKRGIIADNIDSSLLVNKDVSGKACYLCAENIKLQNPKEVLLEVSLSGRKYLAGANFAPITDNHFTVMNGVHRPQPSGAAMVALLCDMADLTDGSYRALYNGLAGASIEHHEHFHITTSRFPIEDIEISAPEIISEVGGVRVSRPQCYVPLWVVEGADKTGVEQAASGIISDWHEKDEEFNTENIIVSKNGDVYRIFIFLRDRRKLRGVGKSGAIAAFECGGIIVLSGKDEELYETVNLDAITRMLESVAP